MREIQWTTTRHGAIPGDPRVLVSNGPVETHLGSSSAVDQCFPFYVYDEDGANRRENITDLALEAFRSRYGSLLPFA